MPGFDSIIPKASPFRRVLFGRTLFWKIKKTFCKVITDRQRDVPRDIPRDRQTQTEIVTLRVTYMRVKISHHSKHTGTSKYKHRPKRRRIRTDRCSPKEWRYVGFSDTRKKREQLNPEHHELSARK